MCYQNENVNMKQEFEGFDFTNFWDDNYYARKEYISDVPTDELIADVTTVH